MTAQGTAAETTAADTEYTLTDLGEVTLGRTTFRVERQDYLTTGGHTTWLHGPRGAVYMLRGYRERGGDTGLRQIISYNSGAPFRYRGNEVLALEFGTHIERYEPNPRPVH